MKDITHRIIDLRDLEPHLTHPSIAPRAASTKIDESFWLIVDQDPVELFELLL